MSIKVKGDDQGQSELSGRDERTTFSKTPSPSFSLKVAFVPSIKIKLLNF